MTLEQELRATLAQVSHALDTLAVPWAIGGSFASTLHGEPRATNDINVVACLRPQHVTRLIAALGTEFMQTSE